MTTSNTGSQALAPEAILQHVERELAATPVIDIHTHLFSPALGSLGLWGIDELITYHYLEAELFRFSKVRPEEYWTMPKRARADLIWRTLFVENAPISEATRGVVAVLSAFGLPTSGPDLTEARAFFDSQDLRSHVRRVLEIAGVSEVVMTNDPLDPNEAPLWERGVEPDPRFHPVLRIDRVLKQPAGPQVRKFLEEWCDRMRPVYLACSLPDAFQYPEDSDRARILRDAVLPVCRERDLPLSLMIGVRYQVNPALRLAGDGVGKADLRAVEHICCEFPENRFLISLLSRENQHELCVYARKFSNLLPFGCWWFLNNPSIVEEMTRERIEMLGASFIPQHSDARILEQLIYKWRNTRRTLAPILANSYRLMAEDGRPVTAADIRQGVNRFFRTNFEDWTRLGRR